MSKAKTIQMRQSKVKQALIEQLKRLPIREVAYDKVGITRMTVSRWRKKSKTFENEMDAAMNEGREFINDLAESQVITLIRQGEIKALRLCLQHNSARYANKLELSGTIATKELPMTKEEKAIRMQALKHSSLSLYGKEKTHKPKKE